MNWYGTKLKTYNEMRNKGFALSSLSASALAVVVLVIVVSIGAQILGQIRDTQTVNTTQYNVTGKGLDAMKTYGDWFTVIVIIVVAVVIIALLVGGLARRGAA